jgi:DNA-binding protein HU-beta
MNANELAAKLAAAHGVTKAQAKSIVEELLREIVAAASSGDPVSLPGFGRFKVKETAQAEGLNLVTGEIIHVAPTRKLTFAPAKAVRDALNP